MEIQSVHLCILCTCKFRFIAIFVPAELRTSFIISPACSQNYLVALHECCVCECMFLHDSASPYRFLFVGNYTDSVIVALGTNIHHSSQCEWCVAFTQLYFTTKW